MNNIFKFKHVLTFLMLVISSYGYAQQINLRKDVMSLEEAFQQIKKQTGMDIVLSGTNLNVSTQIDLDHSVRTDLQSFLNFYFNKLSGYRYVINKNVIVVQELPNRVNSIRGKVINRSTRESIAGATIRMNEMNSIKTDTGGNFIIPFYSILNKLTISYVGYKNIELTEFNKFYYILELEEEGENIDEVVINGIFDRKKESFTGSSTTFSGKELKMIGNQNILQSLKTLDPSFQIKENNAYGSDPNRLPDIEVNGKTSVIGLTDAYGVNPNQPLFILDGFESSLAVINDYSMDRVESITILKDAAAAAIYGSKAANGVVVVVSKRPEPGKLKFSYNANNSVSMADLSDYNLMNAEEKLEYEKQALVYGSFLPSDGDRNPEEEMNYFAYLQDIRSGVESYWLAKPLRVGFNLDQNISATGGDKHLLYTLTARHSTKEGVMKGSDRQNSGGNIRLIYQNDWYTFANNLSIDYVKSNTQPVPFSQFANASPYRRMYNEQGGVDPGWYSLTQVASYIALNPLYDFNNHNINTNEVNSFINNFEFRGRLRPDLNFELRFGLQKSTGQTEIFRSPFNSEFMKTDVDQRGSFQESNSRNFRYDATATLKYFRVLQEKHALNAVLGGTLDETSDRSSTYSTVGFIDDQYANPAFSFGYPDGGNSQYLQSTRRSASAFLSFSYAYDQKYLFDATVRSDGSSVFGAGKQFTTIWSAGLGYNLHRESFLPFYEWEWVNSLRLRASMGNPGNQNFNDYISSRIYIFNQENRNPFGASLYTSGAANPALRWQKTINKTFGLDFKGFANAISITAEYFEKITDPLLVYIGLPSSVGVTQYPQNMGSQRGKGFSLISNLQLLNHKDFRWLANLSAIHMTTTYGDLGNKMDVYNNQNQSLNLTRYYDGASPNDLWAVRSLGINPTTGDEMFLTKENEQTYKHSYQDEVVVGNSEPTITGNLGMTFYYKAFSFNYSIRYRYGGQEFMNTLYNKVENISQAKQYNNLDKRALYDRWKAPGDEAKFKAISRTISTPISSRFVQDKNELVGESFSFGYDTYSGTLLKRVGLAHVMARLYANDLFHLSTIRNERGIENPFARSISFSLTLGF